MNLPYPHITLALAAAALLGGAPAVRAADEVNVARGLSAGGAPLALRGYDPVAYFTDAAPVPGSDGITVVHDGAAYRFASEAHRKQFQSNPARYVPQFGGYCTYGAALGKKFDGDPKLFTVYHDRLYLNLNPDIQATFSKDVAGNIGKAAGNWETIEHKAVGEL